jgi:iron(III) transport system ATP-binding protein
MAITESEAVRAAPAAGRRPTALRCHGLRKQFGDRAVVSDVSLTVPAGDILALVGPSGCGKTTLLRLIAGFEQLDAGVVEIDGQTMADGARHVPPEGRRVGMVFQDYAVFPHLSVGRNVGFALGKGGPARARVAELLAFVGLAGRENAMPHELSGGEQQRVSLARALSTRPSVLLLDEPFSNLDAALRGEVRDEMRALLKSGGVTAVFVTHDQDEALFLGDRIGVMRAGKLEQLDVPETVFHRPQTRFVAEFLGHTSFIWGRTTATGIDTPLGGVGRRLALPPGSMVEVAVRPDDVTFHADEMGLSRIARRHFTALATMYRLTLPDGQRVHSWQPHEGAAVTAHFKGDAAALPCFYEGQAV